MLASKWKKDTHMKFARLAPLVVIALVGCSPSPTTAAEVGDTTISTSRVQDVVMACPDVQGSEITESVALTMLVRTELLRTVGAQHGLDITDAQMLSALKQDEATGGFLQGQPGCADLFKPEVGSMMLSEVIPGEQALKELQEVDVQLNPRFGEWQSAEAVVAGSGSLSVPSQG